MPVSHIECCDCMEFMARYPDKHFELSIVDPPYGIGDSWSKNRLDRFYKAGKLHSYKNDSIPSIEYFNNLRRVSKNQIIWGGNYFTAFLPPTNAWIVWDKGRDADITYMSEGELAWTSFAKCLRIKHFKWDGAIKCEKVNKIHPHQKPVALYRWILKKYARPGDKILDTHLGSGSSRIAAWDMGFDFYGCELDKEYFDASVERFERFRAQLKLELETL